MAIIRGMISVSSIEEDAQDVEITGAEEITSHIFHEGMIIGDSLMETP